MGDHGGWAQPNGLLPNEVDSVTGILDAETLLKAEERTAELIALIQPNKPSEERRKAVANYVQRLIKKCFSCQVCTFGSVPLKTYLPDGDIDLTAFSEDDSLKDTWANDVREVLKNEEKNENAEFRVKEVQYIQAEVKIIKCLVEDIVVDISFDQLGGLCTLCFLEEIDSVINQDHLFKRSIILIKAWCYYESRILGAHHGLISTYALETLVLYVFHVFNNSFSGPLEVLYRFLKFFSNFDWDNFCVSLWGPVPISSLPDMTPEPPRKDSGDLLLSKLFLENCSHVYAVLPVGQDYQSQPFISKHFNVIDPLRVNNNLGRSVSKGNFYRIRSAFAFGAERLASMLEHPKEDLIAEVSQFFLNTWERYGSGHRPDAPSSNLGDLQSVKTFPVQELNDSRSTSSIKKNNENVVSPATHQYQADGDPPLYENSSQILRTINQPSQNIHRSSNPSSISCTLGQKNYVSQINPKASEYSERNDGSSENFQGDKCRKNLRLNSPVNAQVGQSRLQFTRTRSSPELADTSSEVSSRHCHNRGLEMSNSQTVPTRLDHGSRRKKFGSDTSGGQLTGSVDDPPSSRISSSQQSLDAADSRSASNSYHDDDGFTTNGEELASFAETLNMQQEMHQEEQGTVNMMASSGVHNASEQVQLPPIHLASPHLPFPLPPSIVTSMGYSQRNMAGMVPTSIPLIEPPWASNMQFPQGLVSSPLTPYFSAANPGSNFEDTIGPNNKSCGAAEVNLEESDHGYYSDELEAGSNWGLDPDNGDFQVLCSDDKQQSTPGGFDPISTSRASSHGPFVRVRQKFSRENKGSLNEGYIGSSHHQGSREKDDRNGNMRHIPVSQASSSPIKPIVESLPDEYVKASKSLRDRRGRKPASSAVLTSLHGKSSSEYQPEGSSDNSSVLADDEASPHARSHQLPGYDATRISSSDPVIPIAPMLVTGPRQRVMDNSGAFAFYPTGPPIPFLAIPVFNLLSDTGNSAGSVSQYKDEGLDHGHINSSYQNVDSAESLNQSDSHMYSSAFRSAEHEPCEQHQSDILNGDFRSHWQNLQYGRSCQKTHHHAQFMYPSPVMVPPIYLQGHFPWDGAGGPRSANTNFFAQIMGHIPRLVPISPLQPGPHRTSGTGTYLPNPQKASFRGRHTSSTRNHRGSYNYDRNDHADREGSWINSKSRTAGRSHGRVQAEKLSSWPDRFATTTTDNRVDRQWESYRHESIPQYQAENNSVRLSNSSHGSANLGYSMYSVPGVNSNGVNAAGSSVPSVVMLYSYDQSVGYGPPREPLEFGSLGQVCQSGMDEAAQPSDESAMVGAYERRHGTYRTGSMHSSPDQPSSPHLQRAI